MNSLRHDGGKGNSIIGVAEGLTTSWIKGGGGDRWQEHMLTKIAVLKIGVINYGLLHLILERTWVF